MPQDVPKIVPRALLAALGSLWGRSGTALGPLLAALGRSWLAPGASWGDLGASWADLDLILEALRPIVRAPEGLMYFGVGGTTPQGAPP